VLTKDENSKNSEHNRQEKYASHSPRQTKSYSYAASSVRPRSAAKSYSGARQNRYLKIWNQVKNANGIFKIHAHWKEHRF
jgi:hypothetical protein